MEENSYIKTDLMKEEEDIHDAFLNTFNLYKDDFEFTMFEKAKQYWLLSDPLSNETFKNLIDYFEGKEEFEKCQLLMDKKGKRKEFWNKVPKTGKYKKIFKTKYTEDD
tara:strand:- start:4306 stop:4629 length:324 start_codon:yes stop_codon:yes gene_type:complete